MPRFFLFMLLFPFWGNAQDITIPECLKTRTQYELYLNSITRNYTGIAIEKVPTLSDSSKVKWLNVSAEFEEKNIFLRSIIIDRSDKRRVYALRFINGQFTQAESRNRKSQHWHRVRYWRKKRVLREISIDLTWFCSN